MITDILQKSILLIIGILFLSSAVVILVRLRNVNQSERWHIFKTAEYFSAWLVLICFVITAVFGTFYHLEMKKSIYAVLTLNYPEASQALNTNGTRYNMAEIISEEVVERAIEKGALENVTVKQLMECLVVYPCVQGSVEDESKYHISTEFAVEYRASKDTDHLDSENVIKLITSAYKDYYIEQYTDNFSLGTEKPDFDKMEYMDAVMFLGKEATAVVNYLYGLSEKSNSFVTSKGDTFHSIAGKVHQFKETQINQKLRSYILQNGVVKDREEYIDRLAYHNQNVDFDRQKNDASYKLCNMAIDMYDEDMIRVVLVPTWDQSGKYYMGRTKVGVDELSVMAANFSSDVASNEKEIMDNDLIIQKFTAENTGTSGQNDTVDAMIESLYNSIRDFEKEAITAGREYSQYKMNQCIAVNIYGVSLLGELKTLIVFAGFTYVSFILYQISKKFPKKV